ncbi:hypothetical protein AVEN_170323-1 [Araneus ventricosus]|uniref:Uncharacterized protein n=1 Tax=Araneus ventricosus TaxID=182803 RepID=A0A4Y2CAH2_ARAVE|nr:hypothetical protein AVEN_170323-1 [Araneus ventricosus]
MFCRKKHAEIGLDTSKIMILMLKIKRNAPEELEALLHEDLCQMLAELAESLGVDHITVSKHLPRQKSREAFNSVFSWVNSCFNGRKGKVFCMVL